VLSIAIGSLTIARWRPASNQWFAAAARICGGSVPAWRSEQFL